jgi:hypothetical protein
MSQRPNIEMLKVGDIITADWLNAVARAAGVELTASGRGLIGGVVGGANSTSLNLSQRPEIRRFFVAESFGDTGEKAEGKAVLGAWCEKYEFVKSTRTYERRTGSKTYVYSIDTIPAVNTFILAFYNTQSGRWEKVDEGSSGPTIIAGGECDCGSCLDGGFVTTCAHFAEAPTQFRLAFDVGSLLWTHFGTVFLTHDTGCVWVSDVYEDVDLGDGEHDYTWTLTFNGRGIEDVVLLLEDET